jgi:hypothetical protein
MQLQSPPQPTSSSSSCSATPTGLVAGLVVLGAIAVAACAATAVLYQRLQAMKGPVVPIGSSAHHDVMTGIWAPGMAAQQPQRVRV